MTLSALDPAGSARRAAALARARRHLGRAVALEDQSVAEALPQRRALLRAAAQRALDLAFHELRTAHAPPRPHPRPALGA